MTRIPRITAEELISALKRGGFEEIRVRGSHHFLRHADGRSTVVPVHSGDIVGPGLLHKILRDCQIDMKQLGRLLRPR